MLFNTIKHKIVAISLLTASAISYANAGGIPVLDMTSLKQQIENYQQQIKQYNQMIKDYQEQVQQGLNQVKQMTEAGIGMDINSVLGETKQMLNSIKDNLDFKLEDELFQETTDITNACSFLEMKSEYFAKSLEEVGEKITDKVQGCLSAAATDAIDKTLSELKNKANDLREKNNKEQEVLDLENEIHNIEQAQKLVKDKTSANASSRVQVLLDAYENGKKDNPYSKQAFKADMDKLIKKQSDKSLNQKEAAALTNSILLKLTEMSQKNYEASLAFYRLQAEQIKIQNEAKETKYDHQATKAIKLSDMKEEQEFLRDNPVIYDEYGYPDAEKMKQKYQNKH